jgi:hypothetical protein
LIVFGKDKSILEVGDLETSAIAEYLPFSLDEIENVEKNDSPGEMLSNRHLWDFK